MTRNSLKDKRILITCGPTWVPIDDMRVISNKSTGTLGQITAKAFDKINAKVTLLEGPVEEKLVSKNIQIKKFTYYNEFLKLFKSELEKKYDIIIHAAAVSDYKLKYEHKIKISSNRKKLTLDLIPTEKVIYKIKELNPKAILVGFKLETEMTQKIALEKTSNLFKKADCEYVIANSSNDKSYKAFLINKDKKIISQEKSREKIIQKLIDELNK